MAGRITCLFWNIARKSSPFEDVLRDVCQNVDILILAETSNLDESKVSSLTGLSYVLPKSNNDSNRLTPKVFSSNNGFTLDHLNTVESKRLIFYNLKPNGFDDCLLGAIHFPSKLEYDTETQEDLANTYITWIDEVEILTRINKTIIVGDFNMNPFELGMIKPKGFNATLSKSIAQADICRTFHYGNYPYFYNPMWNFLGDINHSNGNPKIPGSYYLRSTTDVNQIYWNVFDNVIMRPSVADNIDYGTLKHPDNLNGHNFLTPDGLIDKSNYSDHLPLKFDFLF